MTGESATGDGGSTAAAMPAEPTPAAAAPPPGSATREADDLPAVAVFRLIVGLAQGLLIYGLYRAHDAHVWPATNPYIIAPLLMFALLVPIFLLQAAGRMSRTTLVIWIIAASALVASLAWYDRYRAALGLSGSDSDAGVPEFALFVFAFAGLFIAQSLISAGDAESGFLTRYRNYFDATWKFGVQLGLAAVFVGVFWGVLELGAVLFGLIKLAFLSNLLERPWFSIPATTLATAAAIHLTDVRAGLVAGIRTVVLTLLSWLLPLMAVLVGGFVLALPATGLDPLWNTKSAAGLLLTAAAVLVVLINAAYQDGEKESARPVILRYAELVASALLVPLVGLAAYALALRVQQYGWTVERIATLACILVASCYALGYTAAALFSLLGAQWMWALESVNIFVAFLILALLLALFTPVADPARLSVLSQVSRLQAGTIGPASFDYAYLRKEGGRYGELALRDLASLKTGPHAAQIRQAAHFALNQTGGPPPVTAADLTANITVHPTTRTLPATFLNQNWQASYSVSVPACLTGPFKCDAFFADLDGDGKDEILIVYGSDDGWWGVVFKQATDASWKPAGMINSPSCYGTLSDLRAGKFETATPAPRFRDIVVKGQHVSVVAPVVPVGLSKDCHG